MLLVENRKNEHYHWILNIRISLSTKSQLNWQFLFFGPNLPKNIVSSNKQKMWTVCSYHVTYAFQSESRLYSYLNVKDFLARSRRVIWSLSDWNWTRSQNHLVRKRILNHLAKLVSLAKWLSVRLRTKWFRGSSPVAVRKSEHHHWILHIRINLDTKFHFKQYWILGPNLPQKGISRQKRKKMNIFIKFRIFKLVEIPNFSLNWQIWLFGLNLPIKSISSLKQKRWIPFCIIEFEQVPSFNLN